MRSWIRLVGYLFFATIVTVVMGYLFIFSLSTKGDTILFMIIAGVMTLLGFLAFLASLSELSEKAKTFIPKRRGD